MELAAARRAHASLRSAVNMLLARYDRFDILLYTLSAYYLRKLVRAYLRHRRSGRPLKDAVLNTLLKYLRNLPPVRSKIEREVVDVEKGMRKSLLKNETGVPGLRALPAQGWAKEQIIENMSKKARIESALWKDGKVSGAVYHGGEDISELTGHTFQLFALSNPMHADVFPTTRQMEAEVIRMCLDLYNGDAETCGAMTTGGTESILMAMKAYRDWGRRTKGLRETSVVVPDTAHAAFFKAGMFFDIDVRVARIAPAHGQVDVDAVARMIDSTTVAIVGSAPCFPTGAIDPIERLAALAQRHRIGLHVDCCLGGFLVPFCERAGIHIPRFDFRVPGVTSISADTHKYGFAPKGTSVIMYRNKDWRKWQYSSFPDWTGGLYATPVIAGSRAGALVACTWTAMMYMGKDGYTKTTKTIIDAATHAVKRIRSELADDLYIAGLPLLSVVAVGSKNAKKLNILGLADCMKEVGGWNLNSLQRPALFHIAFTLPTARNADKFVDDLKKAVQMMKADKTGKYNKGGAALYGMAGSLPKNLTGEITWRYLDIAYEVAQ